MQGHSPALVSFRPDGRAVLFGGLFQELVERRFGVCNDQPFLFGAALHTFALGFLSFGHFVLQSILRFLGGIPHPGFEPGQSLSPVRPRGCKPRAYASSASGACKKSLDVGAGGRSNLKPAPTSLGPSNAARDLTSRHSYSFLRDRRDQIVRDSLRFCEAAIRQPIAFRSPGPDNDHVADITGFFEQAIHPTDLDTSGVQAVDAAWWMSTK